MRKYSNLFKRTQTWILSLAILLSVMSPILAMSVLAEDDNSITVSIGQIVANNYVLTDAEEEIIGSGFLVGGELSYRKPVFEDDLIEVDSDNKEVYVDDFTDEHGNEWKPISVKLVVNGEAVETITLVNGEGSYSYDGNAFSVDVEYALDIDVDLDVQNLLLTAPKNIYNTLPSFAKVAEISSSLTVIEAAMETMVQLATTGVEIYINDYYKPVLKWQNDNADASTLELNEQMTKNGGKLDITLMVNEYKASASKVEYLAKNGAAMKEKAEETKEDIDNILGSSLWDTIGFLAPEGDQKTTFTLLRNAMTNTSATLGEALAMDWSATEKQIVKDGVTALEFGTLDTMVDFTYGSFTDVTANKTLRVDTSVVRYNMSMFDVTVNVVLNVIHNNALTEYAVKPSTVITLAEGATSAEVLAAIAATGIENKALATDWAGVYVDGKFDVVKSDLSDTLTEDVTYTITYSPKSFDVVTNYEGTVSRPYGYVVTLPVHDDALKAYDYTVGDAYCAQGSQFTVLDNVNVTRKEGKAYTVSNFYKIVAENYLKGTKGEAIITSGALKNNVSVNVRYPDNKNKIVSLSGKTLTAANYASSYEGLEWVPYSYTLSTGDVGYFAGSNTVEITADSFANVTVTYRLVLDNFDNATVLNAANIADVLYRESVGQLGALNGIAGQYSNLEMLNKMMIEILMGYVETTNLHDDPAKDAVLKTRYNEVLNNIINNCLVANGNLKLFEIVKEYKDASDKLFYYYNNSASVIAEVSKFTEYMTALVGAEDGISSEEKLDALARIMDAVPDAMLSPEKIPDLKDQFKKLESNMSSYMEQLSAPNDIIDLNGGKLGALTSALQAAGTTKSFTTVEDLYLSDSTIVVVSDGMVAFTATLTIEGGTNVTITSGNINVGTNVSASVINAFVADIEAAIEGIKGEYYVTDYDTSVITALIGKNTNDIDETAFEFAWTYKSFNVSVPGMADQTVSYVDRLISFEASSDPAYRYDYYVNGNKIGDAVYNLTDADLDKVIDGTFKVTVDKVYILRENLVNYVNGLNEKIGNDSAAFALVEDASGKFSIVLKINGAAPNALTGAIMGIAQGVVMGSYPYVGIGGEAFREGSTIYLQSIIDAISNSGFGSQSIVDCMDANGNINHLNLNGTVIGGENGLLGGKLIESTMQLGTASSDAIDLGFYITLGAASEEFVSVRNALAGELSNLFSFTCDNGRLGLTLNMPEKMYEAFLAVLLVTENLNLNNINDVNGEISITFINNMLIPLLKGDITVKTFENTAAKFGLNLNISSQTGVESAFAGFVDFYTNANFTFDEVSGTATGIIGISSLIDSFELGELGNMIAEKDTGLTVSLGLGLENLGKDYEAIYLDVSADGIANKIGLAEDVQAKLDSIDGKAVIILLSDVEADLEFNATSVLNLNGFTVDGDLTCNGKTIVIDSYIGNDRDGTVTGNVSGNAILVAGKYSNDVSEFIKNGYEQDADGVVSSKFFDIVEGDGNIDIIINADLLKNREMPDVASLVIDIACDLLFNGYSSNYLEIDGNTVYNISIMDLVGIYTGTNRVDSVINEVVNMIDTAELSALINTVLDDAFDFTAISEAIANGDPVFEYSMLTKPWAVEFVHVTEDDTISANIVNGESKGAKNLRVLVTGDAENTGYLVDLFAELGKTVSADLNVELTHGKDGNKVSVSATADANVLIDWRNPDYAVMFSVIIADGLGSSANAGLINGIEEFYATKSTAQLSKAFNKLTNAQLIKAINNFNRDDSFAAMVERLGLTSIVDSDVNELESLYDSIGKVFAYAIRKSGFTGGDRTLGSFLDADGAYGVTKENVQKLLARNFFSYLVSAEVEITDAYFGILLFDENYIEVEEPEFVDGHGDPVVGDNEYVSAYKIDYDNKYIILDVHPDGIDADVFKSILTLTANNADSIEIVYGEDTLADGNLVKTGTTITATAKSNITTATDVVEYTVIVLGDVNCDGYGNVGDAILICRELVGELMDDEALTDIQKLACDINNSSRIDIGDATRIANKYVSVWEEYVSFLGE